MVLNGFAGRLDQRWAFGKYYTKDSLKALCSSIMNNLTSRQISAPCKSSSVILFFCWSHRKIYLQGSGNLLVYGFRSNIEALGSLKGNQTFFYVINIYYLSYVRRKQASTSCIQYVPNCRSYFSEPLKRKKATQSNWWLWFLLLLL